MNRSRIGAVLLTVAIFCVACKNEKETPSGLKFTVIQSGDGKLPKKGQIVVFYDVIKDSKDSVWHDSYESGLPRVFQIADSTRIVVEDGFSQMLRMLSEGDSVRTTVSVTDFFRKMVRGTVPQGVDTSLTMTFTIRVKEVMDETEFATYREVLGRKLQAMQKSKDDKEIDRYLNENKVNAEKDTSGIRYVIHSSKGADKPSVNSCVDVKYRGRLMKNGEIFDENQFSYMMTGLIPGWQLALQKLGVGDSATFYIPSELAYGPRGAGAAIPPNAVLIFDVRLMGMGQMFDASTNTCK